MLTIDLPKEPIDGYKVKFYRLSLSGYWCYINEIEAVYYLNTPWDTYRPNDRGGADLVDHWVLNKDGFPEGRILGWENIKYIENETGAFPTRETATKEAAKQVGDMIVRGKQHIEEMEAMHHALLKTLP